MQAAVSGLEVGSETQQSARCCPHVTSETQLQGHAKLFLSCVCLQCDAFGPVFTGKLWTARVSFVVYIMAIQSVMGEPNKGMC